MADADDEVIVTIDPALIEADPAMAEAEIKPKVVIEEPKPKTGAAADDPLESLKGQFSALQGRASQTERERDDALRRASEAEQRATQATQEATTAKTEAVESQYDTVVTGISSAQSEADAAEQAYQAAFNAGDAVAASKAQRKLSEAVAKVGRLEEAKADLESVAKRQPTEAADVGRVQQQQPRQQPQSGNDVDAFLATRTPKTAQWLRDHSDMATALAARMSGRATTEQSRLGAKLTAGHNMAESEGLEADTPEYFEYIEKFIGEPKKPTQTQRRASAPVTPVSHSGGGTNGGGVEVKLTRGEANAANDGSIVWNTPDPTGKNRWTVGSPIGNQEFARRKLAMQKEGRYDRAYLEQ